MGKVFKTESARKDFKAQSGNMLKRGLRGLDAMFRKNMSADEKAAFVTTGDKSGFIERSALSSKQNQLLKKALRQMGLSSGQTSAVMAQTGGSTPRQIIQSALTMANQMQDGSGNNG